MVLIPKETLVWAAYIHRHTSLSMDTYLIIILVVAPNELKTSVSRFHISYVIRYMIIYLII